MFAYKITKGGWYKQDFLNKNISSFDNFIML
jgi:hypothetical protein